MIKPNQILILIIIAVVIIIILALFQNGKNFQYSKLKIFFDMINIITFILLGIGLILTSYAIMEGQDINKINQTNTTVDRSYNIPIKRMNELFDSCPNFVASLWPQKNIFQNVPKNVVDKESSVLELSALMLQVMEDQIVSDLYNTSECESTFLQWASSQKFYKMFLELYPNYTVPTIAYAKVMFEYAQKYPIHSGEDLEKLAKQIKNDLRIKNLKKSK